jgi:hypothetical protein
METKQDRVRFKNRIAVAQEALERDGMKREAAEALLASARQRIEDESFWNNQSDGLAVFISASRSRFLREPISFPELTVTDSRPHIKPLIPALGGDIRFYVLALSQNHIRLYQGTRFTIDQIDPASAPRSLADAMRYDDPERNVQFHTKTSGGPNQNRPAIFHGQGLDRDYAERRLLRYFQKVEHGVKEVFDGDNAPLVLAGVERLLPIYREVNSYPYLLENAISGSADRIQPRELHHKALEIVEPLYQQARRTATQRFRELAESSSPRALKDIEHIVPAARTGRIATLFVASGIQQWGRFDPESDEIRLHESQQPGDEDLLDRAAVETLATGGEVFAINEDESPSHSPAAAVLRF